MIDGRLCVCVFFLFFFIAVKKKLFHYVDVFVSVATI